jgi:hypothetical protein
MMEMCGVQQVRMSNNFKVNDVAKPAGSYYVGLKRRNLTEEEEECESGNVIVQPNFFGL